METAIEITDLVVDRGRREVLRGISATIPRGSVTGLLGPSGSGKTTLMRAVVGVQIVKSGTVTVLGHPAGSAVPRRKIGYLTQSPSVYADLTVRENTRYFAGLYGLGAAAADEAIRDVGLADHAGQLVANLSGGQRSRASLACALVGSPEVLVLDEPTVGQDPVLRDELWERFRGLTRAGSTLLVSSHVMDEANRCDRLLLIREGEIIADGTPGTVKAEAGTDDLDEAFLTLIRARERSPQAHPDEHPDEQADEHPDENAEKQAEKSMQGSTQPPAKTEVM
jgi:ABC-2 type transport system ATP-binding protein